MSSEDRAILSLAGPAQITLAPSETVSLAWLLVRQSSGPQAGHNVLLSITYPTGDHGGSLSAPAATTDATGIAEATFTAGPEALPLQLQVQGVVTDIPPTEPQPPPAAFTITVEDALRVLRPEPPERTRYDGLTKGRVTLAVRATTGAARPLRNEEITWEIVDGGSSDARLVASTSLTEITGVAQGDLECGATPSILTVRATMRGTAPVEFTVNISEWGSCSDTQPCPRGWNCVEGSCVQPVSDCSTTNPCPEGQRCRFGECVTATTGAPCKGNEDCPDGMTCSPEGVCTCPAENPDCVATCETPDPDLAGSWDVASVLHLREALPGWLDDVLGFLGPPFRFLSDGLLGSFDLDIPIIGDALSDALDGVVDRYVPRWVGELLGAIADINDIMSTLQVKQDMTLWAAGVPNEYGGEMAWREVSMTWRGDTVRGRLEDITGIGIDEDSIVAEAVCGTFYIHNHDVSLTIGHIVRWLLDVIVTAVTEGEYTSLEDILGELVYVCGDIAAFVDELAWELASGLDISLPDVYDLVERGCEAGVEAGIEAAMDWIEDLQVSSDMLRLGGHARIESARRLADGEWLGEILGNDFSGEFTADRRR